MAIKCFCKLPFKAGRGFHGYLKNNTRSVERGSGIVDIVRLAATEVYVNVDTKTGVFFVDDNKHNRNILKSDIKARFCELEDIELQNEIMAGDILPVKENYLVEKLNVSNDTEIYRQKGVMRRSRGPNVKVSSGIAAPSPFMSPGTFEKLNKQKVANDASKNVDLEEDIDLDVLALTEEMDNEE